MVNFVCRAKKASDLKLNHEVEAANWFHPDQAKEAILQNLRSNREKMRFFIDNDITLLYYYYDENKKLVSEIRIPPSLYK